MVTKDEVMQILDLETADFDSLQGIASLQKRVEQALALFTHDRILTATDRLSGEVPDDPLNVLTEIDSIIDDKRAILKNAECDLSPIAWNEIEVTDRKWLVTKWLPENTVTMFTGQGGAGKSWLTLQVACEIASHARRGAYLDPKYEIPKPAEYDDSTKYDPKHIVFATYEDEPAEIKRRLNKLSSSFEWIDNEREVIQQHLHIVDMRGIGSVWGPGLDKHISVTGELLRSGEALRSVCEGLKARLLILDPLSGAFGGNENDRTAVYDFISSFRGWGEAAQCAMLVIGHLPKSAEARSAGFSGSTAWEASARAMWLLSTKTEDDTKDSAPYYALQHTKSNYDLRQKDIPLVRNNYHGWFTRCSIDEAIQAYKDYNDPQERDDDELPNL